MLTRLSRLLGPALILYLLADIASASERFEPFLWVLALAALACSFVWLLTRRGSPGAERLADLGLCVAVVMMRTGAPQNASPILEGAFALAAAVAPIFLLELALRVPASPPGLPDLKLLSIGPTALGVLVACVGLYAAVPPFELDDRVWQPASWASLVAPVYLIFGLGLTLLVRLLRPRLRDTPTGLASNSWALAGLGPALITCAAVFIVASFERPDMTLMSGVAILGGLALVVSHLLSVEERLRPRAGASLRRAITAFLTAMLIAIVAALAAPWARPEALPGALRALVMVLGGAILFLLIRPIVDRWLAPFSGRLLRSLRRAEHNLGESRSLSDWTTHVLSALREGSGAPDADPVLHVLDPAVRTRLDSSNVVRNETRPLPDDLVRHLELYEGFVLSDTIDADVVRRPEVRPLAAELEKCDALGFVPLRFDGQLEGVLMVPRGARKARLTLEEVSAIERLARRLSSVVSLVAATRRAQGRVGDLVVKSERLDEDNEQLKERLARLSHDAETLRAGRHQPVQLRDVAYSASMRAVRERLDAIAPLDASACVVAPRGASVEHVTRRMHDRSARTKGPFVVAHCAASPADAIALQLFGDGDGSRNPGWLRLASEGTLVLRDVAAIPRAVQAELADALAAKRATSALAPETYDLDVRIIATSRELLPQMAREDRFDSELAKWLGALTLVVPALSERREDIPSLALLAVDRAARVLGRPAIGIDGAALEALKHHPWRGDVEELERAIEIAVASAEGTHVTLNELEHLRAKESETLRGTHEELERRILLDALTNAGGNKSEAARVLGLKRTTFLGKLRRYRLDGKDEAAADAPPPASV